MVYEQEEAQKIHIAKYRILFIWAYKVRTQKLLNKQENTVQY